MSVWHRCQTLYPIHEIPQVYISYFQNPSESGNIRIDTHSDNHVRSLEPPAGMQSKFPVHLLQTNPDIPTYSQIFLPAQSGQNTSMSSNLLIQTEAHSLLTHNPLLPEPYNICRSSQIFSGLSHALTYLPDSLHSSSQVVFHLHARHPHLPDESYSALFLLIYNRNPCPAILHFRCKNNGFCLRPQMPTHCIHRLCPSHNQETGTARTPENESSLLSYNVPIVSFPSLPKTGCIGSKYD